MLLINQYINDRGTHQLHLMHNCIMNIHYNSCIYVTINIYMCIIIIIIVIVVVVVVVVIVVVIIFSIHVNILHVIWYIW